MFQGRSLLDTVSRIYPRLSRLEEVLTHCHYVVTMGTICGLIGLDKKSVQSMFVFLLVRNILASAVRLNLVGPLEVQLIVCSKAPRLYLPFIKITVNTRFIWQEIKAIFFVYFYAVLQVCLYSRVDSYIQSYRYFYYTSVFLIIN